MSINAIGSPSQLLAAMLSKLVSTTSTTSSSSTSDTASGASPAATASSSDTALTGSGKGDLSSDILGLLMMMQNDPSASAAGASAAGASAAGTSAAGTPTTSTSSIGSNPLSSLVSAIDTNGDGTISQSELESYITAKGGTQDEADALYANLNQNGSGNLTQTQLASDLQNAGSGAGPGAAHHGHHHHHQTPSADTVGSQLVQAMDTNGDSSVDQSEFESFVTALGGTTSQADSDFSALDTQGSGSLTANQFSSAITALEQNAQAANGGTSPVLTLLDDLAGTGSAKTASSI